MQKVTENIFPLEWNLTDDLKVKKHNKKVFGTFVCGGGSTMGYKLAGFDHLGGVEFTEHFSKIYKKNLNPKHFYLEDIRDFNKRTDLPKELYNLDILDGSPPCAAFSTSGSREDIWGKKSLYEGIKQVKDDLVYIYSDTIKKLNPKVFLLENVSGIIKGNAKIYVLNVINRLSDDYDIQVFSLFAASMGLPQLRNRVFIIGSRKDLKNKKLNLNFDVPKVNFDVTKKYWSIFENDISKYSLDKLWGEVEIGSSHKKHFNLVKPSLNKPCPTITATTGNAGAYSVVHPIYKRKLNKEEVRLLSTFPKDYNFLDTNPVTTMGRSVLPLMMANISNQIYNQWLKNGQNGTQ